MLLNPNSYTADTEQAKLERNKLKPPIRQLHRILMIFTWNTGTHPVTLLRTTMKNATLHRCAITFTGERDFNFRVRSLED